MAAIHFGGAGDIALFVGVLSLMYLAPTLLAIVRRTGHLPSIFVMNLLAGWTGVGWWVALSMMMVAAHQRVEGTGH